MNSNIFTKTDIKVLTKRHWIMNYKNVLLVTFMLDIFCSYAQNAGSSNEFTKEQKIAPVLLPDGKIGLTLLSDSVITEGGWYTNALHGLGDGLLLAHGGSWKRNDFSGEWWRLSSDGGITWQPYVKASDKDYTRIRPYMCQRRDGSVIGWAGAWNLQTEYLGRPGQPITQSIMRAPSIEKVIHGYGVNTEATICLPYMVPLIGDDLSQPPAYTPAIWGKLVEADHGYLIQAVYPRLAYDNAPRLWVEHKTPAFKYRTCVMYSQDDGATWHYLSTVASPEQYPLPAQAEGYCEPDLLYFGNGRLLCVMRSGGNPAGTLMERYTPLVGCRSSDGGLTWTPPEPIATYGVAPVLLKMKSGIVVCLSGRPGFFLLFSTDDGKTWSAPHWVSKSNGPWGRSSSGYGQLIETEPGVLGVAYDEYAGKGNDARMVTNFRRYRLE
jgi:hypothetical protein